MAMLFALGMGLGAAAIACLAWRMLAAWRTL